MKHPKFCMDSDRRRVYPGDSIRFSFGIPPLLVIGKVVLREGEFWVLTPTVKPTECRIKELRECVGDFYRETP